MSLKFTRLLFSSKKTKSKKIRRILDDTELGEETKRKIAMEKVLAAFWKMLSFLFVILRFVKLVIVGIIHYILHGLESFIIVGLL